MGKSTLTAFGAMIVVIALNLLLLYGALKLIYWFGQSVAWWR